MTDNPYVEACMFPFMAVYCSKIQAIPKVANNNKVLKHNKYVCILSIAVTTYVDYASMITILGSYIMHVHGCNSYQ
jgi:hypothetical protein